MITLCNFGYNIFRRPIGTLSRELDDNRSHHLLNTFLDTYIWEGIDWHLLRFCKTNTTSKPGMCHILTVSVPSLSYRNYNA